MKIGGLAPMGFSFSLKKKSGGILVGSDANMVWLVFLHSRSKSKHFVHKLKGKKDSLNVLSVP